MHPVYDKLLEILPPQSILISPNGTHGITLVPYVPEVFVEGRTTGYRLYVEVKDPVNMPTEIFVHQRKPITWGPNPYKDEFIGVASPADLEEYPITTPIDALHPFFRLATVDLVFRNVDYLVEAAVGLGLDVQELTRTMDGLELLETPGDILVGKQP